MEPTLLAAMQSSMVRTYSLSLNASFDELNLYLSHSGCAGDSFAKYVLLFALKVAEHPPLASLTIDILSIRRGSIIIEYSLQSNSIDVLRLAMSNIAESEGDELLIDEELDFAVIVGDNILLSATSDESSAAVRNAKERDQLMWSIVWVALAALVSAAILCVVRKLSNNQQRVAKQAIDDEADAFDGESEKTVLMVPVSSASAGDMNETTKLMAGQHNGEHGK